eukprot:GHVR01048845.1.p1 GENE.GHVR01048845.1~~GHVR01048845.1.p1  ORF type:complete len:1641 (+),score=299.72 GHVR01048845.1:402-5324(+)
MSTHSRVCPLPGQVEIRVRAVGVNFRDVLNVMGLYPGDPGPPGADCAGTVVRVGPGVNKFKPGDDVFGIAQGCLKSFCITSEYLLASKPASMSFEAASALPVVYVTVEHAFRDLAKLKGGEKVLVHAVTGGIGVAALQYCKAIGAEVYGTCSDKKVDTAYEMGVKGVASSRDSSKFAEEMSTLLDGKMFDVVLNSLNGEFIPESLKLLRPGGRWMEIGKREVWSKEQMNAERPDVQYETIAVDVAMEENPAWFGGMLDRIKAEVDKGHITPMNLQVFNMYDPTNGGVAAMRFMQRAQHIGKVVITIPSALGEETSSSKVYAITGGLGSLGQLVAKWMIEEGAKNILLLSRRGKPDAATEESDLWKYMQESSASVTAMQCDVSSKDDCAKLADVKGVAGIIHAAGVIEDATLPNQTLEKLQKVYAGKVFGAWNLHEVFLEKGVNLDFFVLFSSVASLFGNYGQCNYSAANAALDSLAHHRRSAGLVAQSIQWGAWVEQGMAAHLKEQLHKLGMRGISNDLGLRVLYDAMRHANVHPLDSDGTVVACQSVIWRRFTKRYVSVPHFLANVSMGASSRATGVASLDMLTVTREELGQRLCQLAQEITGASERQSPLATLMDLGLDSLGAVEFRSSVLDLTGCRLPQSHIFENPKIDDIASFILSSVGRQEPTKEGEGGGHRVPETVEQWLKEVFSHSDRHLSFLELFCNMYPSVEALVADDQFEVSLRGMGVTAQEDFTLLSESFNALCQLHADVEAGSDEHTKTQKQVFIHPLDDVEELSAELSFDVEALKPPVSPKNFKHVLLTGVTGFVGRVLLKRLLQLPQLPNLMVHCVVRAEDTECGMQRIITACNEAKCWEEWMRERVVVVTGDFTQRDLGLGEELFLKYSELIDAVFHIGGDVNLMSNYMRLRETNTLAVRGIVRLCTMFKIKPLHFSSTLGQFPSFFACFAGEFSSHSISEDSTPLTEEMEKMFPPARLGYPWSKMAAEQVLSRLKQRGLPVFIYRLPNTYVSWDTGYTNKSDYACALTISSLLEGCFPSGAATAPFTPVDTICDIMAQISVLDNPTQWVFHLVDPRVVTKEHMEEWAAEVGVSYKGVSLDDFLHAVKQRGHSSPVFKFVPLMQLWRHYWFDNSDEKLVSSFPISVKNVFELLPHMKWPPMKDTFKSSFLYLCEFRHLHPDSLALRLDADHLYREALNSVGGESDPTLSVGSSDSDPEYFLRALRVLCREGDAVADNPLTFQGKLALVARSRQVLKNVMYMSVAERLWPDIKHTQIAPPVFIIGHARAAGTLLQRVMSMDPEVCTPTYCEMAALYDAEGEMLTEIREMLMGERQPSNASNASVGRWNYDQDTTVEQDSRIRFATEQLEFLNGRNVNGKLPWQRLKLLGATLADEDYLIFDHTFRTMVLSLGFKASSYKEWLIECLTSDEVANSYVFLRRFLQHLQWQRKVRYGNNDGNPLRWVVKSPYHALSLKALFTEFPDAKVICVHRDPMFEVGQWAHDAEVLRSAMLADSSISATAVEELETVRMLTEKVSEFGGCSSDVFDLHYDDLMRNPVAALERVYKFCNMPLSKPATKAMWRYVNQLKEHKEELLFRPGSTRQELADLGVSEATVQAAFFNYYKSGLGEAKRSLFGRAVDAASAFM